MNMTKLTQKCIKVVNSCKTQEQLDVAVNYANKVWLTLPDSTSWIERVNYLSSLQRLIGYTQRNVQLLENSTIENDIPDVVDHIRVQNNRMRRIAGKVKDIAFEIPAPNTYTPRLVELALLLEER